MLNVSFRIKTPKNLSPRIQWLRDFFFEGTQRKWNNEFTAWTTGTPWDSQFNELTFYIVPETYPFFPTFRASLRQAARQLIFTRGSGHGASWSEEPGSSRKS